MTAPHLLFYLSTFRGPYEQPWLTALRFPSRQNLHVYISEHEHFTDFNATSALFWEQQDLVYGDWTSGENSDGCYEHFAELDIPQVGTASGFRLHGCWASTQGVSLNQLPGLQSGVWVPSLALPSVHTLLSTG